MEGAGEPRTGKEVTTEAPTFPVPWGLAPVAAALVPSVHSWPTARDRDPEAWWQWCWPVWAKANPVEKQQLKKISLTVADLAPSSA